MAFPMFQSGGAGRGKGNGPPGGRRPLQKGHYTERGEAGPGNISKALQKALIPAGVGAGYTCCITCLQKADEGHRGTWLLCPECHEHGNTHVGDPCPLLYAMNDDFWRKRTGLNRDVVYRNSKSGDLHTERRAKKQQARQQGLAFSKHAQANAGNNTLGTGFNALRANAQAPGARPGTLRQIQADDRSGLEILRSIEAANNGNGTPKPTGQPQPPAPTPQAAGPSNADPRMAQILAGITSSFAESEMRRAELTTTLTATQDQLAATQQELRNSQQSVAQLQLQLSTTQQSLNSTQHELARVQQQLNSHVLSGGVNAMNLTGPQPSGLTDPLATWMPAQTHSNNNAGGPPADPNGGNAPLPSNSNNANAGGNAPLSSNSNSANAGDALQIPPPITADGLLQQDTDVPMANGGGEGTQE
jgi:hypothetical protein